MRNVPLKHMRWCGILFETFEDICIGLFQKTADGTSSCWTLLWDIWVGIKSFPGNFAGQNPGRENVGVWEVYFDLKNRYAICTLYIWGLCKDVNSLAGERSRRHFWSWRLLLRHMYGTGSILRDNISELVRSYETSFREKICMFWHGRFPCRSARVYLGRKHAVDSEQWFYAQE